MTTTAAAESAGIRTQSAAPGRLSSPLAMAIILPLLVLISGLVIGWISRAALHRSLASTSASALNLSTERTRSEIDHSLKQSRGMLDALRAWLASRPRLDDPNAVARDLLAIASGRPGVALVSFSTPAGAFHAVQRHNLDWHFVHARVDPNGATPRWVSRIGHDRSLTLLSHQERSGYDPRLRPFYLAAMGGQGAIWTEPYVFFESGLPGITCAEAVGNPSEPATAITGVIAVDFDLSSLGAVLQQVDSQYTSHSVLFTAERVLVGLPDAWLPPAGDPSGRVLLNAARLNQPLLNAYFAALPALPHNEHPQPPFRVRSETGDHLASVSACPIPGNGPVWYVGMILPRSKLMAEADHHMRLSLIIGLLVLAVSTVVAWWFARHLARSRNEATLAHARAREAENTLREFGSYRLLKQLGKGGMGEVWLAQHRMLARPAAIKLIKADTLQGRDVERRDEIRKRFASEARITANLRSRNTIELYDYGITDDGTFYYVMELLEGIDLFDLVRKHGRLPPARVVHLMVQACHSLAEAHDLGLVHRDIKAENLFICRRADEVEVIKVLDFGIVRMQHPTPDMAKTRQGLVQGTPATMSPEQASDQLLDGRSDLYSLGCVAYWLLTGKQVFAGDCAMELLTDHVQTIPTPPSERIGQPLPPALEAIIMSCLAKDPGKRPRDARELAVRLRNAELGNNAQWGEVEQQAWWRQHLPPKSLPIPDEGVAQVFSPKPHVR